MDLIEINDLGRGIIQAPRKFGTRPSSTFIRYFGEESDSLLEVVS